MPRFVHPNSANRLSRIIAETREIKEAVDQHEPVAGHNRAILQEASADLSWGLIALERALLILHRWKLVGNKGGRSLTQRLNDSKLPTPPKQD